MDDYQYYQEIIMTHMPGKNEAVRAWIAGLFGICAAIFAQGGLLGIIMSVGGMLLIGEAEQKSYTGFELRWAKRLCYSAFVFGIISTVLWAIRVGAI